MNKTISVFLLLLSFSFLACKKKAEVPENYNGATYFSIKDFVKDQWNTFHGQPIAIQQVTALNGKTDTILSSALTMQWSPLFKLFFATDISDKKFLNQYNFSSFEDEATTSRSYEYVAKNEELYTQKLQINTDLFTNKVRSIFIETRESTFWNVKTQKLLYSPMHVIHIQEHNDPLMGKQKDLVIDYKFM